MVAGAALNKRRLSDTDTESTLIQPAPRRCVYQRISFKEKRKSSGNTVMQHMADSHSRKLRKHTCNFALIKKFFNYLRYFFHIMHTPNLRLDLSIAYTHIPKLDPLYGLRSVYTHV